MPLPSILKGFLAMQMLGQCVRLWVLPPLSWYWHCEAFGLW